MTHVPHGWTALVLAGQRPGVDPVAAHFGLEAKALVPVAGELMLGRVLMALADQQLGRKVAREAFPQIRLNSPKITRKLTTEWFARRVDERFRRCLAKGASVATG